MDKPVRWTREATEGIAEIAFEDPKDANAPADDIRNCKAILVRLGNVDGMGNSIRQHFIPGPESARIWCDDNVAFIGDWKTGSTWTQHYEGELTQWRDDARTILMRASDIAELEADAKRARDRAYRLESTLAGIAHRIAAMPPDVIADIMTEVVNYTE